MALPEDSALQLPDHPLWEIVGVAIMWLGSVVRVWAIAVLGNAFRTTGVLLITTGSGVAAGNWLSLLLAIIIPAAVLSRRIQVEEKARLTTLGSHYDPYRATTKRLVPGLW
ncbi:methyltransferase family protein [Nocardia australiensis]|uniref:methyltransferase family protein n=1 Tax=Nocardia australiensis TaxID=2887191 RepID=UPI001D15469A|nr:hypothetical protein [Nocardia australiensis]